MKKYAFLVLLLAFLGIQLPSANAIVMKPIPTTTEKLNTFGATSTPAVPKKMSKWKQKWAEIKTVYRSLMSSDSDRDDESLFRQPRFKLGFIVAVAGLAAVLLFGWNVLGWVAVGVGGVLMASSLFNF